MRHGGASLQQRQPCGLQTPEQLHDRCPAQMRPGLVRGECEGLPGYGLGILAEPELGLHCGKA